MKAMKYLSILAVMLFVTSAYAADLIVVFKSGSTPEQAEEILLKYGFTALSLSTYKAGRDYTVAVEYQKEEQFSADLDNLRSEDSVERIFLDIGMKLNSDAVSYQDLLDSVRQKNMSLGSYSAYFLPPYDLDPVKFLADLSRYSTDFAKLEEAGNYLNKFPRQSDATVVYIDSGLSSSLSGLLAEQGNLVIPDGVEILEDSVGHGTKLASLGLAYDLDIQFISLKAIKPDGTIGALLFEAALDKLIELTDGSEGEPVLSGRVVVNMSFSISASNYIGQAKGWLIARGYSEQSAATEAQNMWSSFKEEYREKIAILSERGVVFVASTSQVESENNGEELFPSLYNEVISVGRTQFEGREQHCDILAPDRMFALDQNLNVVVAEGVSFGAGLVSAFISQILGVNPNLTTDEIRAILRYSDFA
ncbi:MAG: S8/S53 family peptidase, partial [Candidatus Omnitrophica bacterium]|nr:S8/S53 family peptidase [Candidatus Omnitrophota bacterium]